MSTMAGRARLAVYAMVACVVAAANVSPAEAHGESRGLHLHLAPDPATPGATVTVEVSAADAVRQVEVAFTGGQPVRQTLDPPRARFEVQLKVPDEIEGETINAHAEVKTRGGRTLRASAVLRIAPRDPSREAP